MEPNRQPTFDESITEVMKTLPPVVRAYLAQGKYTAVAKNLMRAYNLRIDQGGVLERGIMLLLMGVDAPDEFTASLIDEAKIEKQTVNKIIQDMNAQIFVPLREEMRKGAVPASVESARPTIQMPKPAAAQPPRPTAQMAGNEPFRPKSPAEVKLPQPQGQRSDLRDVLASVTREVPREGGQTSPNPEKLLEDHEEPHIEFHNPQPQRTIQPPPANLPGVLQRPVPPPPLPRPTVTSAPIRHSPSTVVPYSDDPYREPLE